MNVGRFVEIPYRLQILFQQYWMDCCLLSAHRVEASNKTSIFSVLMLVELIYSDVLRFLLPKFGELIDKTLKVEV